MNNRNNETSTSCSAGMRGYIKGLKINSGVKATGSVPAAENKSDFKIYRPHWSKTKSNT